MLVSQRYRFIFVHVPKTAGRSIKRALRPYSDLRGGHLAAWGRRLRLARPLPSWQLSLVDHVNARQIRDAAPAEFFRIAFKFAVVRNPWDWHVSMYHYLKTNPQIDVHGARQLDFPDFLESKVSLRYRRRQRSYLVDEGGRLLVDFVGRFEYLRRDFDRVLRVLAIRAHLPRRNRSFHRDFRSYYTPRLWQIVADRCRHDIALFGYEDLANSGWTGSAEGVGETPSAVRDPAVRQDFHPARS